VNGGETIEVGDANAVLLVDAFMSNAQSTDLLRHLNAESNYARFLTPQMHLQIEEMAALQERLKEALGLQMNNSTH
jgi:hypothetical protein